MTIRFEDLDDTKLPPPRVVGPLTRTDFVRYQGASGDMNPLHHDEEFAKKAGLPAPLAVGMLQAGVLAAWATDWFGPANVRRTRIRWKEQVWPGDVLTFSGTIAKKYQENGENKVDLELVGTRQNGGVAVQMWMTFVVPDA